MSTLGPNAYLGDALLDIRTTFREVVHLWHATDAGERTKVSMQLIEGLVSLEGQIANALADLEEARLDDKSIRLLTRFAPDDKSTVTETRPAGDDDEPASDVHASESPENDSDPVALARSMQQRRHGGGR